MIVQFVLPNYVAPKLGVTTAELRRWTDAPTANFPQPVASLIDLKGREQPMWNTGQIPALRAWVAGRLALSDPAAYWALVDSGGKPAGGHLDQAPLWADGDSP